MTEEERDRIIAEAEAEFNHVVAEADAEHDRVITPAKAEFVRVVAPAKAEFVRVVMPARAEYERVEREAFAKYARIQALARAERNRIIADAEAKRAEQPIANKEQRSVYKRVESVAIANFRSAVINHPGSGIAAQRIRRQAQAEYDQAIAQALAEYKRVTGEDYKP